MSVAVLGGSFDPVHNGHVALIEAAFKSLGVDHMSVMPAKRSPLKTQHGATQIQRLEMLELALADIAPQYQSKLCIDSRELNSECDVSYTVTSMRHLREELGPNVCISFVMGWDSLQSLDKWWHWQTLFSLVNIAVVARPGYHDVHSRPLRLELESRWVNASVLSTHPCGKIAQLSFDVSDISSSAIRSMSWLKNDGSLDLKQPLQQNSAIWDYLPNNVAEYIAQNKLYVQQGDKQL